MRFFAQIHIGTRPVPALPFHAITALFISVIILVGVLFALDWKLTPGHGNRGALVLPAWYWEDKRINLNNDFKNLSCVENPVWTSKGFPVDLNRKKSKRILVTGDSFVWGDGYANMNDLWWRQLERELVRRGYGQIEVIAMGYPGLSTRDQLHAAMLVAPKFKPDLIIWGYTTNDPDERMVPGMSEADLLFSDTLFTALNGLCRRRILPNLSAKLRDLRQKKISLVMGGEKHGYAYAQWELQILHGPNWEQYRKTAGNLKAFLSQHDLPSFVMTLPSFPCREYHAPRFTKVKELYESFGIPFYDVLDDLMAKVPDPDLRADVRRWGINPVNSHPGAAMTRLFAVLAADILEKDYRDVLETCEPGKEPVLPRINDWVPFGLNPVALTQDSWVMEIPLAQKYMLRMPSGEPFVQLNLERAVPLRAIRVAGQGLDTAKITITAEDPELGYDDGTLYPFGEKAGTELVWDMSGWKCAESVNTIRLKMRFNNSNRRVRITLVSTVGGVK
jgi:hypothetical protein